MRHILRTFLLSTSLVVKSWAVDIVGIETVQFNTLLTQIGYVEDALQNDVVDELMDIHDVLDDEILGELTDIHSKIDDIEEINIDIEDNTGLVYSGTQDINAELIEANVNLVNVVDVLSITVTDLLGDVRDENIAIETKVTSLRDYLRGEQSYSLGKRGIVETNQDMNATIVHVDEDLHEILEAMGELNITQEAILIATEGNQSISVVVDANGTIEAIEALDLQGVIDAVDNGAVAIVAKNDQIRDEIMTNTAETLLFRGDFANFAIMNGLGQQIIGDGISSLNNKFATGNYIIPQPLDVNVVGESVEVNGTVEVSGPVDVTSPALTNIQTAAEALQAIANDGNSTDRANALRTIIDQILNKAYVVGAVEEQGWIDIAAAVTDDMPSVAESVTGVGTMNVDVWERGGGLQSYDLFDTSAYYAGIPSLSSFANWVKAAAGLLVLALYWKYNWLYLNRVMSLKITAVETNPVTNHGGSFGGVINVLLKGTRIGIITIAIPVFIASVVLMFEVGAGQSIWASFNANVGDVIGAGSPTYAQRAWDFLSAFVPIETIQTLMLTFTVGWLFIMTKMFGTNRVLRAAS